MRLKFLPEVFYKDKGEIWLRGYFEQLYSFEITDGPPSMNSEDFRAGWAQALQDKRIGAVFKNSPDQA